MRVRRGKLVGAALAAAALGAAPFACSSPPPLLGAGSQCFQTTDCEEGLACVEQKSGPNICSKDFSPIVSTEDAATADARMMALEGGEAASRPEGGGSEGSAPPPPDTGSDVPMQQPPPETGAPPQDAQPPKEAAPPEASAPDVAQDTFTAPPDSGAGDASGG
jgi:hypothetical protein